MVSAALIERLEHHLPSIDVRAVADGHVAIDVGGGVPELVVDPSAVGGLDPLTTPSGDPAVRIAGSLPEGRGRMVVMVLEGDVAFAPDPDAARSRLAPGALPRTVADLPPVVGYHELTRYLAAGAETDIDGDRLLALALAGAACMAGAAHVGLDVSGLEAELTTLVERARSY